MRPCFGQPITDPSKRTEVNICLQFFVQLLLEPAHRVIGRIIIREQNVGFGGDCPADALLPYLGVDIRRAACLQRHNFLADFDRAVEKPVQCHHLRHCPNQEADEKADDEGER